MLLKWKLVVTFLLTLNVPVFGGILYSHLDNFYVRDLEMVKCNLKIIQPVSVYNVSIQIGDHKKLDLSGTLSSTKMLNAPIKASVILKKKTWLGWITMPCTDKMGSCDYNDLCSYGYPVNKECPEEFIKNNIPCRCPIPKGNYTLPPSSFEYVSDQSVFDGKYKGSIIISHENTVLSCYSLSFSLEER